MNDSTKSTIEERIRSIAEKIKKSKYMLILLAAGLILILLPGGKNAEQEVAVSDNRENAVFDVEKQEEKLRKVLSQIRGAGRVSVMLTVKESEERILAEESEISQKTEQDSAEYQRVEKILVTSSDRDENPVTVKYVYPEYLGAIVVAEGADNAGVKLALVEATSSVTGLGSNRIKVIKMK